jgi:L-histidine N-alpha-methyltransferase
MNAESQLNQDLVQHALWGLSQRPRQLSPRYLYDARGSELFERITGLQAYYPTRTEIGILRAHARDIASFVRPRSAIIEPGAASCEKVEILLAEAPHVPVFVGQDVSPTVLERGLAHMLLGDFTEGIPRPAWLGPDVPICVFFPGSTLGNFGPRAARELLSRFSALSAPDGQLLLGVDLVKSAAILQRAYDDPSGVTAAFNLNYLHRLVREAGARLDVEAFRHEAVFNASESRIEMWLRARVPTRIELGGQSFVFEAGDGICTEHSYKFTRATLGHLGEAAGYRLEKVWTDPREWFAVCAFSAR